MEQEVVGKLAPHELPPQAAAIASPSPSIPQASRMPTWPKWRNGESAEVPSTDGDITVFEIGDLARPSR